MDSYGCEERRTVITWRQGRLTDYHTFIPKSASFMVRGIFEDAFRKNTITCYISDADQDPEQEELFLMGRVVVCRYCAFSIFTIGVEKERFIGRTGIAQHGCHS